MQRVGLGVECSGLVVDGGQISNVEQEGEEKLRKKREKGGSLAGAIWAVGDVTWAVGVARSGLLELG